MPTRMLRRNAAILGAAFADRAPIYVDADDNQVKLIPAGSGTTEILVPSAGAATSAAGATLTLTRTHAFKTIALDQSGGTAVTLPAATATGDRYYLMVTVASNANTVLAAGSDKMAGGVIINDVGDTVAATADFYRATVASSNKISPTTAGGGGAIGDFIELTDVLSAVWMVTGIWQTATDPTNPFSAV